VVPAYKRPELLLKAVRSLFGQEGDSSAYEVIVVDSSPSDETVTAVAEIAALAPCPFLLLRKRAEGPGPSRNLGARHARAALIAFMDSDCEATPGWTRAGKAAFAEGVGIVQGHTLPNPDQDRSGVLKFWVSVEQESFLYETANIFYARACFEEAGGFPADLSPHAETPMGGEDVDLAWRVKRRGWRTRFAPDAVVHHEIRPISIGYWLINKHLFVFPWLLRRFPELRQFFFLRYFYDRAQAALVAALTGFAFAWLSPLALLGAVPYAAIRFSEPTKTLRGPLRLVRVLAYFVRDGISLLVLVAGSIRYRTLLL
jgi:glycosyltransferase involved in cell wall biosynthesis